MSVAKLEGQRALIHVQNDDHQQGTHNGAAPTAVRVTIRVEQPATLAAVVSVGSCVHLACSEAHAPRAPGLGVAKRRVRIAEAHEDIAVPSTMLDGAVIVMARCPLRTMGTPRAAAPRVDSALSASAASLGDNTIV